jgi:hypothetical protein
MNKFLIILSILLFSIYFLNGCANSSLIVHSRSIVHEPYDSDLSQQDGNCNIYGTITDINTHKPIVGANVRLVSTGYGHACNINGFYKISNVYPWTYDIKGSMIGYKPATAREIKLIGNKTICIDFELVQDTSVHIISTVN